MEYRFFYSINENIFNTKWRIRSDLENRIDIYFILPSISNNSNDFHFKYGLKLRNKTRLELKIREECVSNGQEYWIKRKLSHKKLSIDDMDSILKALKEADQNQLIERLVSSQSIILCYINKFREQKMSGQELTGLHCRFIRLNDQSQIGNDLFFETVCIEQSNSKLIDEKIIEKVSADHGNHSINPMGYPEFLFRQYQQIINQ